MPSWLYLGEVKDEVRIDGFTGSWLGGERERMLKETHLKGREKSDGGGGGEEGTNGSS